MAVYDVTYMNTLSKKNDCLNESAKADKYAKEYFGNDMFKVVEEINKASKLAFVTFRDKFASKNQGEDKYSKNRLKELDDFYKNNKTYPKFDSFNTDADTPSAILNIKGNNDDFVLFYQDEVSKTLNKSESFKNLGYRADTEDYPGIYIYKKK